MTIKEIHEEIISRRSVPTVDEDNVDESIANNEDEVETVEEDIDVHEDNYDDDYDTDYDGHAINFIFTMTTSRYKCIAMTR